MGGSRWVPSPWVQNLPILKSADAEFVDIAGPPVFNYSEHCWEQETGSDRGRQIGSWEGVGSRVESPVSYFLYMLGSLYEKG